MAKQTVNIGSVANDGTGDTLRASYDKLNDNNNEIYTLLGNGTTLSITGDATVSAGAVTIADDAVTAAKLANSINTEIAANTAKVTNATHTGDVTGATALTIGDDKVITAKILDANVTTAKIAA
ncbi:MAG: hypothetical protein CMI60_22860, partial [Parvibaculum sp.]|nr:hypothetical protein [Parvibaculum sp.]